MKHQDATQMRRKDRAVDDESWFQEFLDRAPFAAFATQVDGQPFIHTNTFVYDRARHAIFFHTAGRGRTRDTIGSGARICFSLSEMGRLLPAEEAMHFSVEYRGLTVFGRACVVEDHAQARAAMAMLMDKYFPHLRAGVDYREIQASEMKLTAVYRIDIDSWSGKQKREQPDFPGAFSYPQASLETDRPDQ